MSWQQNRKKSQLYRNQTVLTQLMTCLWFFIHPSKSELTPAQDLVNIGACFLLCLLCPRFVSMLLTIDDALPLLSTQSDGGCPARKANLSQGSDLQRKVTVMSSTSQDQLTSEQIPGHPGSSPCHGKIVATEWTLLPDIFTWVTSIWKTPYLDLFAACLNHRLPIYVSLVADPRALQINALSMDRTDLFAYSFLPCSLLDKVIKKIELTDCTIILMWPRRPLLQGLLSLLMEDPLPRPPCRVLLFRPLLRKSSQPESHCLKVILEKMQGVRFSESALEAVPKSWRMSSSLIYNNRWDKFFSSGNDDMV